MNTNQTLFCEDYLDQQKTLHQEGRLISRILPAFWQRILHSGDTTGLTAQQLSDFRQWQRNESPGDYVATLSQPMYQQEHDADLLLSGCLCCEYGFVSRFS